MEIEKLHQKIGSHLSLKLFKILREITNLSDRDYKNLSEYEGWQIVYSSKPRQPPNPNKGKLEICFTGFSYEDKDRLVGMAFRYKFNIVTGVTKNLKFLCIGDNPGPAKIKKAKSQNTQIITEKEFLNLLKTGEIPL